MRIYSKGKNIFALVTCIGFVILLSRKTRKEEEIPDDSGLEADYVCQVPVAHDLPWYFSDGTLKPGVNASSSEESLWPGSNASNDRIVSQLMFAPDILNKTFKKIYLSSGAYSSDEFSRKICPVWNCITTSSVTNADAVVFRGALNMKRRDVPPNQVWIIHLLENPYNTRRISRRDSINWTASYRTDSELVTPYAKWVYYREGVKSRNQSVNYASGKSSKVAWIVSNCRASNLRMEYAMELKKYIRVDVFGSCGAWSCPKREIFDCFEMLSRHYKFYLSFENGNCVDYITEKFFRNGLGFDMIPVVMGARREDYERVAPRGSYLHVEDFPDAKSLADYLHILDGNDSLFNSYFEWKGTGEFIHTHFLCRLCAMLNSNFSARTYGSIDDWWRKPGICVKDRWDRGIT